MELELAKQSIFVTGATGLVGSHFVEEALLAGFDVVALLRYSSDDARLQKIQTRNPSLTLVKAELNDSSSITKAMQGCSVVVHCAAAILPLASYEQVRLTNVEGTRSIAHCAIAAGVLQMIHISSLSTIMGDADVYGATEEAPYRFSREAYANSKIEAEQILLDDEIASRLAVTILRPGFIYGAYEKAWLPRVINGLRSGRTLLVGSGEKETNVIYVRNLCKAIKKSLLNEIAFGRIYNLTDGQKVSKRHLFDTIADNLGLPRVRFFIPHWAAQVLVESACALAPLSPTPVRQFLSLYSRPALRLAAMNQGFDISRAELELNYVDRISFEEGMKQTCNYWRNQFPSAATRFESQTAVADLNA